MGGELEQQEKRSFRHKKKRFAVLLVILLTAALAVSTAFAIDTAPINRVQAYRSIQLIGAHVQHLYEKSIYAFRRLYGVDNFDACCSATTAQSAGPYNACHSSMELTPMERPGRPWEEHRHWLQGETPFNGSQYVIIDTTTNDSYHWGFSGNENGVTPKFGVTTRWALLNGWWKDHTWLLLYECV